MNAILDFFNAPWLQALGYTLLHSLWEASLVGATVIIVLRFLPEKFSNVRYAVASVGLLAILSSSNSLLKASQSFAFSDGKSRASISFNIKVNS